MTERELLFYRPVEQINRFDILISDPHKSGDPYTVIDSTENLSLQEVWEWLCEGGEWSFRVTAHGQPDKIFMNGLTRCDSLRAAVAGETLCRLCTATEEEITEFQGKVYDRVLSEMKTACTQKR